MPAIAGMLLVSEEGLVSPGCRATVLPDFQPRLFATLLGSLSLGFPFGWPFLRFTLGFLLSLTFSLTLGFLLSLAFGLLLGLTFGLFLGLTLRLLLGLTFGLFLGLTLRLLLHLAFSLLLGFTLGLLFRLTLSCFSLRSAAFSDLSLRLLTRYFPLLRDFSLRSFFTRLLFGSHNYLRVGYPALSIYNRTEKSSKSSDAVIIFESAIFG